MNMRGTLRTYGLSRIMMVFLAGCISYCCCSAKDKRRIKKGQDLKKSKIKVDDDDWETISNEDIDEQTEIGAILKQMNMTPGGITPTRERTVQPPSHSNQQSNVQPPSNTRLPNPTAQPQNLALRRLHQEEELPPRYSDLIDDGDLMGATPGYNPYGSNPQGYNPDNEVQDEDLKNSHKETDEQAEIDALLKKKMGHAVDESEPVETPGYDPYNDHPPGYNPYKHRRGAGQDEDNKETDGQDEMNALLEKKMGTAQYRV